MVFINYFLGQKILKGEVKGVIFGLVGCALILADPMALRKGEI